MVRGRIWKVYNDNEAMAPRGRLETTTALRIQIDQMDLIDDGECCQETASRAPPRRHRQWGESAARAEAVPSAVLQTHCVTPFLRWHLCRRCMSVNCAFLHQDAAQQQPLRFHRHAPPSHALSLLQLRPGFPAHGRAAERIQRRGERWMMQEEVRGG